MLPNSNTNLFFSHHARLGLEQPSTSSSTTCKRAERKTAAARPLGRSEAALNKAVMVTLKAALEERSLDSSGQKAALVSRLLEALLKEDAA